MEIISCDVLMCMHGTTPVVMYVIQPEVHTIYMQGHTHTCNYIGGTFSDIKR